MSEESDEYKLASDHFHQLLGYCIAKWADVEWELFRICWKALGCELRQAAIVFCRSPTLEIRLRLTAELVESVLPEPLRKNGDHPHKTVKRWRAIVADIDDQLGVRNFIAHHPAEGKDVKAAIELDSGGFGPAFDIGIFAVYLSDAECIRRKKERKSFGHVDLENHLQAVSQVARDLDCFFHDTMKPLRVEPPQQDARTPPQ